MFRKLNKNRKQYHLNNRGMTMTEVMVTTLIFSFIIAGLYAAGAVGQNNWDVNDVQIGLQQELRKAMEWMINDLRQAGNASIVDVPADGNWYTTITFKTPSGVTGGSIDWNANSIQFVLGGSSSNQLQRLEASQTKIIAQNIQTLQFRRLTTSPDILEVNMLAQNSTVKGTQVDYQLDFEIQLRN